MMCITLINGLVLINAYIGINHRLQNLLMSVRVSTEGTTLSLFWGNQWAFQQSLTQ